MYNKSKHVFKFQLSNEHKKIKKNKKWEERKCVGGRRCVTCGGDVSPAVVCRSLSFSVSGSLHRIADDPFIFSLSLSLVSVLCAARVELDCWRYVIYGSGIKGGDWLGLG